MEIEYVEPGREALIKRYGNIKKEEHFFWNEASGVDGNRKEFQRLIAEIQAGHIHVVIIINATMIARDWQQFFEFNEEEIIVHHLQGEQAFREAYHFFVLTYRGCGGELNTFNVYMRVNGGKCLVDVGACVASISVQSMGVETGWDGTVTVEDSAKWFVIVGGLGVWGFTEIMKVETMKPGETLAVFLKGGF